MIRAQRAYDFSIRNNGYNTLRAAQNAAIRVPACETLGITFNHMAKDHVVFGVKFDPKKHANHLGTMHGGAIAAILDTATGCALYTTLPKGKICVVQSLDVEFQQFVTKRTSALQAKGYITKHHSFSGVTTEAALTDTSGRTYAKATAIMKTLDLNTAKFAPIFRQNASQIVKGKGNALCTTLGIKNCTGMSGLTVSQALHYNHIGTVHGGITAALIDAAADDYFRYRFPEHSKGFLTKHLHVDFLKPVTTSNKVIFARTDIESANSDRALVSVTDIHGTQVAKGDVTYQIR